jgi:hypothetical protein
MITRPEPAKALAILVAAFILVTTHCPSAAGNASALDTARFLAGMQPSADSPLTPMTREPSWQRHAKFFNASWSSLEQRQLSKIRAWSATNLTRRRPVLLYMFSGPDFLYADTVFPNAETYVLSGLEPVGQIPDVTKVPTRSLPRALAGLRESLNSILSYSFFITKAMHTKLSAGPFKGTLPILFVFLARSGKTVHDVSLVSLDITGAVGPADRDNARGSTKGVKIIFSGSGNDRQTLFYFQTDLSNQGTKNSGFLTFCAQLGSADSLVKSASYLMHSDSFSKVREFLLDHSDLILQDDSGIPVQYLKPGAWQLTPFGRYLGPIPTFQSQYQRKLNDLFRRSHPSGLDFGIGYRWRPNESNLLLAEKRSKPAQSP